MINFFLKVMHIVCLLCYLYKFTNKQLNAELKCIFFSVKHIILLLYILKGRSGTYSFTSMMYSSWPLSAVK